MPAVEKTKITINFDSHISKVTNADNIEWTTSGEGQDEYFQPTQSFTVTLDNDYILDTVEAVDADGDLVNATNITNTTFQLSYNSLELTITLTSKQTGGGGDKMTYDLSTSSKWSTLSDGDHTVTIVAKGDGYRDSEPSAGVTVTKAPSVISFTIDGTSYQAEQGMTWEQWVDSSYNTSNNRYQASSNREGVVDNTIGGFIIYDYSQVNLSDLIVAGRAYTVASGSGGGN